MSLTRRAGLAGLVALAASTAMAQGVPRVGRHYLKLAQRLPGSSEGKIEVIEFFWYGCPHCASFEPQLNAWVQRLPAAVEFKRVHVGFSAMTRAHQRLFCTLETMGVEAQVRTAIFAALHQRRETMETPQDMLGVLQKLGVSETQFNRTWTGVDPLVAKANALVKAYGLDAVPSIGIGGLYLTSPELAEAGETLSPLESGRRTLAIADYLIQNFGKV